jgi:hypothetical protein
MPGPLPRWLTGCAYPFLPLSRRPSPKVHWVGCTTTFRSTTSERGGLTRLQSFDYLQASEFACHPGRPHRWHRISMPGRPWRLHPSKSRFVASPRIGHTSRPNRAIDGRGLSPPRSTALLAATGLAPPILCQRYWRARFWVKPGPPYLASSRRISVRSSFDSCHGFNVSAIVADPQPPR